MLRWGHGSGRSVRPEVEDLTQEVFCALFIDDGKILRSWDPERGLSFKRFIGLVAYRQAISILKRRRKMRAEVPMADELLESGTDLSASEHTSVEQKLISKDMLRRVHAAMLEELSPLGRQLFELTIVEERSVQEVCRLMDMSPDAVYAWRSRLPRLARRLLGELASRPGTKAVSEIDVNGRSSIESTCAR